MKLVECIINLNGILGMILEKHFMSITEALFAHNLFVVANQMFLLQFKLVDLFIPSFTLNCYYIFSFNFLILLILLLC